MAKQRLLFLTNSELGQANVHLAVLEWLQSSRADVELHLCSFNSLRPAVTALNQARGLATGGGRDIAFHELSGPTWKECLFNRAEHQWPETTALAPTVWNASRAAVLMPRVVVPWNADELLDLTLQVKDIVQSVEADLLVVDNILTPAMTICYNINTPWCVLSPNTYREFLLASQPRYESFWKHPPTASLIPFPVPFYMIPAALYYQREWRKQGLSSWVHNNAVHLWEKTGKGILYGDWGRLSYDVPKGLKIFLPSNPTIDFPFSKIPEHIVSCGPIVRSTAAIEEADPRLAAWLRRRPTVYINLGTHVAYQKDTNMHLAGAIKCLLDAATQQKQHLQVLWKVNRGKTDEEPVHSDLYKEAGVVTDDERLLIVDWLLAEPTSILQSGSVVCSVNHGGANTYFEAVSAGVPQIVLPVWLDTYDFARRVEYFGIGKIGNYHHAPQCSKSELAPILLEVVLGKTAKAIRQNAAEMAATCSVNGPGCEIAARGILGLLPEKQRV
ncbi:hypothetical protein MY3296_009399 [Beauveria thailandica]